MYLQKLMIKYVQWIMNKNIFTKLNLQIFMYILLYMFVDLWPRSSTCLEWIPAIVPGTGQGRNLDDLNKMIFLLKFHHLQMYAYPWPVCWWFCTLAHLLCTPTRYIGAAGLSLSSTSPNLTGSTGTKSSVMVLASRTE